MSLYESNSAEATDSNIDPAHNVEVILRLPDLDQINAEFTKPTTEGSCQNTPPAQLKSEQWEEEMVARSKFLGTSASLPSKNRKWKIAGFVALAGVLSVALAQAIAMFYPKIPNYDSPAPDAPPAPAWKSPEYANDKTTDSTTFDLPVNLSTPSLPQGSNSGSFSAEYNSSAVKQLVPPGVSRANPNQVAVSSTMAIPEGPNVSGTPVFPNTSHTQGSNVANGSYPTTTSNPYAAVSSPNVYQNPNPYGTGQQVYPATQSYGQTPTAQITNANRFSPERVQQVLRNQEGAVQNVNYPQSQITPNVPAASYPQTLVPTVAQRPNTGVPSYPVHTAYPTPESPSSIPPVSPYPPASNGYPTTTTVQNQTSQNWPAQQTNVTPSAPQQQPAYPTTGYPVPNTAATPPYYQGQFYR